MKYQGKKVVGVWIDHKIAHIIATPDRQYDGEYDVRNKVQVHEHPNHTNNENVNNNKANNELNKMYDEVSKHIAEDDVIYLIGPGTAQEEFKNYLGQNSHFRTKEIEIGTADHPTKNQMVAEIRTHFFHN
jgi:stalled ribosome rescue protein Dom34